jgi:sorting nexin-14
VKLLALFWQEFLARFVSHHAPTYQKQTVHVTLGEVMKSQSLLFKFMQFLKENGSVHLLQFVLAVDDLNQMVIQPELTDSGKRNARLEVEKLYK